MVYCFQHIDMPLSTKTFHTWDPLEIECYVSVKKLCMRIRKDICQYAF